MPITDTDAKFYRKKDFGKVLEMDKCPGHGLAKNSNLQYVYHFIFINFVKNSLSS